jgi:hypothetical protein
MNMATNFILVEAEVQKLIDAGAAAAVAPLNATITSLKASVSDLTMRLAACQAQLPAPTPIPTPTPSPTPTGWPDATNTGAKGILAAYTGSMTIITAGTVIENKDIKGVLSIKAANVTLKNCRLTGGGFWGIDASFAPAIGTFIIQDCTIIGPGAGNKSDSAVVGSGTFLRNDISKFENGIRLQDGKSVVKDNYVHDLQATVDGHYDGIAAQGGQNGVLIEHNTVIGKDTSDIFIKNDFGPINDVTVNNNLLLGTPAYNVYSDGRASGGPITNVKITNNVCHKGVYGYFSIDNSSPAISGNTDYDTGKAI